MASQWQIECLRSRMASLKREIARVRDKHHPYPEPRHVYDSLTAVLQRNERLLDDSLDSKGPVDLDKLRYIFASVQRRVETVAKIFRLVDRVDSARIPFEILQSLSLCAGDLLGHPCRVIIHLEPVYNYRLLSLRRLFKENRWSDNWRAYDKHADTSLPLFMSFPSYDVGSIALHVVAAHELGHELAYLWSDELRRIHGTVLGELQDKYRKRLNDYIEAGVVKRGDDEPYDAAHDRSWKATLYRWENVTRDWLSEIAADLIAVRLVGPAFLAGLERVSIGLQQSTDGHPSDSLRRALLREYMESSSEFREIVKEDVWQPVLTESASSLNNDWIHDVAREFSWSVLPHLTKLIARVRSPFARSDSAKLVEDACGHIGRLVPPSVAFVVRSLEDAADAFWLLLYSAWRYRLDTERFGKFRADHGWHSNGDIEVAENALDSLLLHSLQSIELSLRCQTSPMEDRAHASQ